MVFEYLCRTGDVICQVFHCNICFVTDTTYPTKNKTSHRTLY